MVRETRSEPRLAQDPMKRTCAQSKLPRGGLDQRIPSLVQLAVDTHLFRPHVRVGEELCPRKAPSLRLSPTLYPLAYAAAGLAQPVAAQFLIVHAI